MEFVVIGLKLFGKIQQDLDVVKLSAILTLLSMASQPGTS
jgi:hypothetical protein